MSAGTTFTIKVNAETAAAMSALTSLGAHLTKAFSAILPGIGIAGLLAVVQKLTDEADRMGKLAQQTGIAVEQLAGLAYAAKQENIEIETLQKSLKSFSEYMVKTGQGSRNMTDALMEQAQAFSRMEDGARKAALANEVFGKGGMAMIPLLNDPGKLAEGMQRGTMLSGITTEIAEASEKFNDSISEFWTAAKGLGLTLSMEVVPALTEVANKLTEKIIEFREFWQSIVGDEEAKGSSGLPLKTFKPMDVNKLPQEKLYRELLKEKRDDLDLEIAMNNVQSKHIELDRRLDPETKLRQLNEQKRVEIELIKKKQAITMQAFDEDAITKKEYEQFQSKDAPALFTAQSQLSPETIGQTISRSMLEMVASFGTVAQQISDIITGTIGTAISAISNGITGLIMGTKTWGQAMMQIGVTILTSIVQAIVTMGVRWVATQLMMAVFGRAIMGSVVASTVPMAAASAAIWATPATLATIASYGGAAAAAPGFIALAQGATMAESMAMFEQGGYTGPGGRSDFAGMVHRGEFVFSAPAVDRIGLANLNAMHNGAASGAGPAGGNTNINFAVLNDESQLPNWTRTQAGEAHIIDVVRRNYHRIA